MKYRYYNFRYPVAGCLPTDSNWVSNRAWGAYPPVRLLSLKDVLFLLKLLSIPTILIHRLKRWIGDGEEEPKRGIRRTSRAVTYISSPPWPSIIYSGFVSFDVLDDAG